MAEGGKADGAKPKAAGGETRKAISKIGNSDTAEEMKRCVVIWPEEVAKEALGEIWDDKSKLPASVNGAMLVMNEVEWPEADQKKTWEKMFQKVCERWLEDQCYLDQEKRFVPPKGCDSHCVWNWDAETADKFLENIGVKKLGLTGAKLFDPVNRDKLDMDDSDKVGAKLIQECGLLMQDMVKSAS